MSRLPRIWERSATRDAVEAKANDIRTAKYTEIQTLMTKDTGLMPDQSILWTNLARADLGLKKYDDAATNYKKATRSGIRLQEARARSHRRGQCRPRRGVRAPGQGS